MKSVTVVLGYVVALLALALAWRHPGAATAAQPPTLVRQAPSVVQLPQSVELEYFIGAAHYPDHILLEWQSVSEIGAAGYRLYRFDTPTPNWNDPNLAPLVPFIPVTNPGGGGAYYFYEDSASLSPGVVYYYWIEDQDSDGNWNQHRDDPDLNPRAPWGCSRYDVVCNFAINSEDITAVALLWNCASGNACYDADFDVNNDFVIDMRDLALVASRWGCQLGQPCYP